MWERRTGGRGEGESKGMKTRKTMKSRKGKKRTSGRKDAVMGKRKRGRLIEGRV